MTRWHSMTLQAQQLPSIKVLWVYAKTDQLVLISVRLTDQKALKQTQSCGDAARTEQKLGIIVVE